MRQRIFQVLPTLLLAAAGAAVSILIENIHRHLEVDVTYTSFCNVNSSINCDVVLSSQYAWLFGVSVSLWALLFYVVVAGLAAAFVRSERIVQRQTLATWLLGLAGLGFAFSLYMAFVAFVILDTVCLMCSALYVVSLGLFFATYRLRAATQVLGNSAGKSSGEDRRVLYACVGAALALVASAAWSVAGGGKSPRLDAAGLRAQKADLVKWYQERPKFELSSDGQARGPADAPVTLVEFSDFDCPHCAKLDGLLTQLIRAEKLNVRVVFRHFPLSSDCNPAMQAAVHPRACLAATAAECAGEQDRFWQYQHNLFANQGRFQRDELIGYARDLGLDVAAFVACLGSEAARARVERDAREGQKLGIESTPTLFINGRRIEGAPSPDVLLDVLTLAADEKS